MLARTKARQPNRNRQRFQVCKELGEFLCIGWISIFFNSWKIRPNQEGLQVHVHVNAGDGRGSSTRGGRRGRRGRGGRQAPRERALPDEVNGGVLENSVKISYLNLNTCRCIPR